ncbi:MAG: hypothetical protein HYT37_03915 [Candidatus Sungbacteria bacterium]|nr:hypothetical protein [Candidatus Sungbacteria bacterium]
MKKKNLMLPGNPRYQPKSLQPIFGYDNLFSPVGEVEIATMQTLGEIGIIAKKDIALLTPEVIKNLLRITTTEVEEIERSVTKHDIRAWVRNAQEIAPSPLKKWIHVPLTSYDALDTARSLQFFRAYNQVLKPLIRETMRIFIELTRKLAGEVQIGRTHGQHALPITVGFWFATILNRICYNTEKLEQHARELAGKISGAVGAHNAQYGLGIEERCGETTFEERVLAKLNLKPAPISTQILPPEPLAYFLHSCIMLSAVLAQFGRDGRNFMRSEIAELAEGFEDHQVGSSSMAHKRNPLNFENIEGMWFRTKNEFGKVLDTLLSEHQRDLVGSSVARDFPIIVVNLTCQLETLLRKDKNGVPFLSRISIDQDACRRNFNKSASLILAEPIYIALQMAGYEHDAHELVNRLGVPLAKKAHIPLIVAIGKIAEENTEVKTALGNIPSEIYALFRNPSHYTGNAREKALEIAAIAETYITKP